MQMRLVCASTLRVLDRFATPEEAFAASLRPGVMLIEADTDDDAQRFALDRIRSESRAKAGMTPPTGGPWPSRELRALTVLARCRPLINARREALLFDVHNAAAGADRDLDAARLQHVTQLLADLDAVCCGKA